MSQFVNVQSEREPIELRLYADEKEKILLLFNPLKISKEENWNPMWEEWNCYKEPLIIYLVDYNRLLKKYFDKIFPTQDAFDGTEMECFDVCFDNWIGSDDWEKILAGIEADFGSYDGRIKEFYMNFICWIRKALECTSIIVVSGNL